MRSTVSTRQPPAGGPGGPSHPDALLRELRHGERDAFVRYFELFRAPVYALTRQLLDDEAAAVAATTETFSVVLRRVVLDERLTGLATLTYRCALDACVARADVAGGRRRPAGETSRRFEAALAELDLRRRAALLLHDLHGLGAAGIAAVFAINEEAAGALLFRAREEFREAFVAQSARPEGEGRGCRQAEQAVAGAVGLGLAGDQLQRLRLHAAYCRPCRRAMRAWGAAPAGLAAVLETAPLPPALAAAPVFGAAGATAAPSPHAGLGAALRPAAGLLRSRAAAYVVAVACLALAAGVAINAQGVRPFILFQSVGPAVQLVTGAPDEAQTGARQDGQETAQPAPSAVTGASFIAAGSQLQAATPAVQTSSAAPAAPAEGGPDAAPREVVAAAAGAAAGSSEDPAAERGRSGKDKADGRTGKDKADGRSAKGKADRRSGQDKADRQSEQDKADRRTGKDKADRRSGQDKADRRSGKAGSGRRTTAEHRTAKAEKGTAKAEKKAARPAKRTKPGKPGKPAKSRKAG